MFNITYGLYGLVIIILIQLELEAKIILILHIHNVHCFNQALYCWQMFFNVMFIVFQWLFPLWIGLCSVLLCTLYFGREWGEEWLVVTFVLNLFRSPSADRTLMLGGEKLGLTVIRTMITNRHSWLFPTIKSNTQLCQNLSIIKANLNKSKDNSRILKTWACYFTKSFSRYISIRKNCVFCFVNKNYLHSYMILFFIFLVPNKYNKSNN